MINKLNALGDACPIPVIKARNALKDMGIGETLVISVDNSIATENLAKMAKELGHASSMNKISDEHFDVTIIKGAEVAESAANENIVVAIGSDTMGEGAKELGETLLKGFIYAITELDQQPKTILFYNGGAKITTEGSQSIDDLKKLEEQGVEILTCGACLNYYGIADKLVVGAVTNMYAILEKMTNAAKVIKP